MFAFCAAESRLMKFFVKIVKRQLPGKLEVSALSHITIMRHIYIFVPLYPCIRHCHSISYGYILGRCICISDDRADFLCS